MKVTKRDVLILAVCALAIASGCVAIVKKETGPSKRGVTAGAHSDATSATAAAVVDRATARPAVRLQQVPPHNLLKRAAQQASPSPKPPGPVSPHVAPSTQTPALAPSALAPKASIEELSVTGCVHTDEGAVALVENLADGETMVVRQGSQAFGYRVVSVSHAGATLERDGQKVFLALGQGKRDSSMDIWTAAAKGNREELVRLLETGTSVNARKSDTGATPLNMAALHGRTDIAKLLIDKGADVTLANKDGNTALHIASFFAHVDLVELLLKNGASVSAKSRRGETPLDVVSAAWSPQLGGIYKSVGKMVGVEVDLARIEQTRPRIAKLLRDHAGR